MKRGKSKDFFGTIFSFIFPVRKLNKILRFPILFLFVFLFTYSTAYSASSYYVDNSVASSGNGTQGSPWKNFSNINWTTIASASKPCTILVSGGATTQTYNETLSPGASGTASTYPYSGTPTTEIIMKRPSEAEWAGHSGWPKVNAISVGSTRKNIVIDGFEVSAGTVQVGGTNAYVTLRNLNIHDWTSGNLGLTNSGNTSYVTIQGCWIHSPGNSGDDIMQIGPISYWTIERCLLEHYPYSGSVHADAIQFSETCQYITIRYNIIRNGLNTGGVYMDPGINAGGPHIAYVYGNIFEIGIAPGSMSWQAVYIDCEGSDPTQNYVIAYIYNNTFVNMNAPSDTHSGIMTADYCNNTLNRWYIRNNIFYNSQVILGGGAIATALDLDYNLYYRTSAGTIISWGPTSKDYSTLAAFKAAHSSYESHGLNVNPLLASVTATPNNDHDLRLTSSSPAKDTGDSSLGAPYNVGVSQDTAKSNWPYSVTTVLRPQGSGWDMGAYEYGASGNPSPPKNLVISP